MATLSGEWFVVNFNGAWLEHTIDGVLDQLHRVFRGVLQEVQNSSVRADDLIRVHISHPGLILHGDIVVF